MTINPLMTASVNIAPSGTVTLKIATFSNQQTKHRGIGDFFSQLAQMSASNALVKSLGLCRI